MAVAPTKSGIPDFAFQFSKSTADLVGSLALAPQGDGEHAALRPGDVQFGSGSSAAIGVIGMRLNRRNTGEDFKRGRS
jgi:hypothetical protein